jgi:NAD(P)-dependent dehydrogenase (short-subunit alcohol dehydrogenase family)
VFELNEGAALVTGASSGIGAALAVGLAQAGVAVACVGRDQERLHRVCDQIAEVGGVSLPLVCDLSRPGAATEVMTEAVSRLGRIKYAVNCAATYRQTAAVDLDVTEWDRVLALNLRAVFENCRAEALHMFDSGGGAIVNIGSVSADISNRGWLQSHYNASKAGVVSLTRSLGVEWAKLGVRVNAVSPGYTKPSFVSRRSVREDGWRRVEGDIPVGRWGWADEMVGPVVFLLSDAASYCIGVNLRVDGGLTSW